MRRWNAVVWGLAILVMAVMVFAVTPVIALAFGVYPLVATHGAYALRFWPYAAALELKPVGVRI